MARNTNRQGADFELDVMHYLDGCACEATHNKPRHVGWRGFGYDSLRSSGSRGAVDIVAVGPPAHYLAHYLSEGRSMVLFIQCKITNPVISPADRRRIQDIAARAGGFPLVAYRALDTDTGRMRPHFRLLTGLGPKDWAPWEPGEDD